MNMRTIDVVRRTDGQATFLRSLLFSLDPFFRIRHTIPARQIQAFLLVAEKEGLSVGDYAQKAGLSATTMSRNLLDMGERDRNGDEGAGLIKGSDDIMDRRARIYHLTPKGRALLASITQRVR